MAPKIIDTPIGEVEDEEVQTRMNEFGLGIGVMNLALRRLSVTFCVGCPSSSSSQCRDGYA